MYREDSIKDLEYIQTRLESGEIDIDQAKFESAMIVVTFISNIGFEDVAVAYYEATNEF